MTIATLGIDLGKSVFHLVGQDAQGRTMLRRRMTRGRLITLAATLPACRIGMEACCGAHYLGRILAGQGHDVRLVPAQYVRPFVKSHKNDYVDAEAIANAPARSASSSLRSALHLRRRRAAMTCSSAATARRRRSARRAAVSYSRRQPRELQRRQLAARRRSTPATQAKPLKEFFAWVCIAIYEQPNQQRRMRLTSGPARARGRGPKMRVS